MGIFGLFKKKEVTPVPPPLVDDNNVRGPVDFPQEDISSFSEESFSNEKQNNNTNISKSNFNTDELSEIPPPPKFENLDDHQLGEPTQPFNPNIPNFNQGTKNNSFMDTDNKELSSSFPNPFESDFQSNPFVGKKFPTFAERFGTSPENKVPVKDEVKEKLFEEPTEDIHTDFNQDFFEENHQEEFKFNNFEQKSNNKKLLSKHELPLQDDFEDNITPKIDEHIEEKLNQKTIVQEEKSDEPQVNKISIHRKGSSVFININGCAEINSQIVDIKSKLEYYKGVYNKVLDLEKKSDNEYTNWKKNMESIQSLFFSIDKKMFR
jgi:hypothetical protein